MSDAAQSLPAVSQPSGELVGRVVADRFRVDELIGSGAMGAVYRALHVHTRKQVALKVLHRELTGVEEVVARFEREAVAAGRVEHPNVAGALDFGRLEDGTFYLVLEYVAGQRLRSVLAAGPLPLDRALPIARQVALALGAAHAAGIVHRDLKPDNVMLLDRGGSDMVKVLDFGIAKVSADAGAAQITRMGTIIGTPDYMSPEQALGNSVDHRADLYALGVMLYEMLTGKTPFSSDDVTQVLMAQITRAPDPLPDTIPAPVREVVERLLAKDPAARPQTAEDAVSAIDSALGVNAAFAPTSAPSSYMASAVSTVSPGSTEQPAPSAEAAPLVRRLPRAVWVGGALLVLLGFVLTLSMRKETPPPLVLAPSNADAGVGSTADKLLKKGSEPAAEPVRPTASSEWSQAASDDPEAGPAKPATKPARGAKPAAKPAKKPPKKQPQKRRTGPGGIYIPPPSQWF